MKVVERLDVLIVDTFVLVLLEMDQFTLSGSPFIKRTFNLFEASGCNLNISKNLTAVSVSANPTRGNGL